MVIIPDAQGPLTPQFKMRIGEIHSSKLLWLSSLPARMKKMQSSEIVGVVTTLNIDFQKLFGNVLCSLWWGGVEYQTHPSFNGCPCYLQE